VGVFRTWKGQENGFSPKTEELNAGLHFGPVRTVSDL
jgi:hypothetical protein